MAVRRTDFAGSWYPGEESDCRKTIEMFARKAEPCPDDGAKVIGGIVPHAGWFFSGSIACNVVFCLSQKDSCDTCLIFGRHLRPKSANYIMPEGAWQTPLGHVEIDSEVAEVLLSEFTFTVESPTSHEPDNTIELQLPFIKYFLPNASIVPLGLPPSPLSLEIGRRAAEICLEKGRSTLALGSTDLTHYGYNYGFVPKGAGKDAVDWVKKVNDRRMLDLMEGMADEEVIQEALKNSNACCSGAAAAAISATRELGAKSGKILAYSTSYDVRADSSFVGYVGVVFTR